MRKRLFRMVLPALCLLLVLGFCLYHSVGWFRGDLLEYLKEHCTPGGSAIVSGEYLGAGEDEEGGFVLYRVETADGCTHTLRTDVVFRRTLGRVGPDYIIKGIRENGSADLPVHP